MQSFSNLTVLWLIWLYNETSEILCILLQIGWALACTFKTEKFYDAFGSTGFITVTIATLTYTHFYYARQIIASIFVWIWALRLGGFLLFRVLKTGKDSRFEGVVNKPGMLPLASIISLVFVHTKVLQETQHTGM